MLRPVHADEAVQRLPFLAVELRQLELHSKSPGLQQLLFWEQQLQLTLLIFLL